MDKQTTEARMAAISFINPKGGSGKTTLAMVLAQEFARRGGQVAVIDADPNSVIAQWGAKRTERGDAIPFHIEPCPTENTIGRVIESLSETYDFVLVDLEGIADLRASRTMSRSHLVLIPLNPSSIDANLAAKAIEAVDAEAHNVGRAIPLRVVRSRDAAAVQSKTLRRIKETLTSLDIPSLTTGLVERAAYRDIFEFSKTLSELDPNETSKLAQAKDNAAAVANEVIETLRLIAAGEAQ
jgi:chromosome partitioning protein